MLALPNTLYCKLTFKGITIFGVEVFLKGQWRGL